MERQAETSQLCESVLCLSREWESQERFLNFSWRDSLVPLCNSSTLTPPPHQIKQLILCLYLNVRASLPLLKRAHRACPPG